MKIGGITLDNDLIWDDEFKFTQGTGITTNTIYGNTVIQLFPTANAAPLTLSGDINFGWQSRATVLALQALARDGAAATHTVILPDERSFLAVFRNDEMPVVDFTPITKASAPGATFWYYGTIKMRIVA